MVQVCYTNLRGRTEDSERQTAEWARVGTGIGKEICNGRIDQEQSETEQGSRGGSWLCFDAEKFWKQHAGAKNRRRWRTREYLDD